MNQENEKLMEEYERLASEVKKPDNCGVIVLIIKYG